MIAGSASVLATLRETVQRQVAMQEQALGELEQAVTALGDGVLKVRPEVDVVLSRFGLLSLIGPPQTPRLPVCLQPVVSFSQGLGVKPWNLPDFRLEPGPVINVGQLEEDPALHALAGLERRLRSFLLPHYVWMLEELLRSAPTNSKSGA